MKRKDSEVVNELNKLFHELAHNLAIMIAHEEDTDFMQYLVTRIYYCLYMEQVSVFEEVE